MNEASPWYDALSLEVRIVLAVLVVAQVALQVYALVDLARRSQVVTGRKWIWVLIILLGELPGAIIYLAIGRRVPAAAEDPMRSAGADADRSKRAVDLLYGKRDEP